MSELKTLDELMQGKYPGEIRVAQDKNWLPDYWFRPYFKDVENKWNGLSQDIYYSCFTAQEKIWKIYTEPKPVVVRWQWAVKYPTGDWFESDNFFTDEEALKHSPWDGAKVKKLEYTRTEFDE